MMLQQHQSLKLTLMISQEKSCFEVFRPTWRCSTQKSFSNFMEKWHSYEELSKLKVDLKQIFGEKSCFEKNLAFFTYIKNQYSEFFLIFYIVIEAYKLKVYIAELLWENSCFEGFWKKGSKLGPKWRLGRYYKK